MSETPLLGLPLIESAQAQKHVTHNEALLWLDAAVHLSAISRAVATPPASPADGDRYLVAAAATGAWAGHAGHLAYREAGSWRFAIPREGWRLWIADEQHFFIFDGAVWKDIGLTIGELQNLSKLGVNTTADATNRLAVKSAALLFDNVGGGVQAKINKNAAADTASLLFQTNYSGRAELGLAGDNDFRLKVSANGSAWNDAIAIDRATGAVSLPNTGSLGISDGDKGDISVSASGSLWTIDSAVVSNAKLSAMAALTIKGNNAGATAAPIDLTAAQVKTLLAIAAADVSGLGALATQGAVSLTTQATGTLQAAQHPAHTGDVTNTAGSLALAIANAAVTTAKMGGDVTAVGKSLLTAADVNAQLKTLSIWGRVLAAPLATP